jgi:hypothetical protein
VDDLVEEDIGFVIEVGGADIVSLFLSCNDFIFLSCSVCVVRGIVYFSLSFPFSSCFVPLKEKRERKKREMALLDPTVLHSKF